MMTCARCQADVEEGEKLCGYCECDDRNAFRRSLASATGYAVTVWFSIGLVCGMPLSALICGWHSAATNFVMMMLGAWGLFASQKLQMQKRSNA